MSYAKSNEPRKSILCPSDNFIAPSLLNSLSCSTGVTCGSIACPHSKLPPQFLQSSFFFFSCAFFALSMCVVIWERWCEGGSRWREAAHLMHTACSKESGDVYSHLLLIWLSERGFGKRSFHLFLVMWSTICQRKKSITSKHRKYILILYVPCMTLRYTSFFFGFLFFLFFFLSFSFCFRFKAGQL